MGIKCEKGCACHTGKTADDQVVTFVAHLSCLSCGNQVKVAEVAADGSSTRRGVLHATPWCPWFAERIAAIAKHPAGSPQGIAASAALEAELAVRSKV
jgi:hypothetical protein